MLNAGNGIRLAGAHDVFMSVAEKLGIPVVTGWDSEDCIYDAHPLYVGRAGNMGDRPGNFAVQKQRSGIFRRQPPEYTAGGI